MIESLTKDQEIAVNTYYTEYQKIGINTDETDRSVTEEITKLYKMMGKDAPFYIFVDSPYEANVVFSAMASGKDFPELDDAIDSHDMIPRNIIDDVASNLTIESFPYIIGNLNTYWLCFLNYAREVLGIEYDYKDYDPEILDIWTSLIKKTGYFFCEESYCIICNRPKELHFDENNELHNEEGVSVSFRRGNECDIYSLNGVTVPKFVIESPETITSEMIKKEENAEVKRIMMEQMGIGKYLEDTNAKLIDADTTFVDVLGGKDSVPRALMEDREGRRFLVASDGSTKRVYHMQVDKSCNTCVEASQLLAGGHKEEDIIAVG